MDILTPKGQQTLHQEREAVRIFGDSFPEYKFTETPKDRPADIDGIISLHGTMVCGVEVKCRNMTMDVLVNEYGKKWLVTADKIDRCVNVCKSLAIDFRGFLYLVPEKTLLIVPIWSYKDGFTCKIDRAGSLTQGTVNGGIAYRVNAYIHIENVTTVREV